MFVIMLVFYKIGWLGGGDVKILTVAFLWTGLSGALPFAVLLALFCSAHGLAAKLAGLKARSPLAVAGVFRSRPPLQPR